MDVVGKFFPKWRENQYRDKININCYSKGNYLLKGWIDMLSERPDRIEKIDGN